MNFTNSQPPKLTFFTAKPDTAAFIERKRLHFGLNSISNDILILT